MSTLSPLSVADWFSSDGLIASVKPNFKPREGQEDLADLIIAANQTSQIVIAECPTGFGKSFTVLVPAIIEALSKNQRIVITTETLTLQDQYVTKDLPLLLKALAGRGGQQFTFAVAKGKNNYVCRNKLSEVSYADATPLQMWAESIDLDNSHGCITNIPESVDYNGLEWLQIASDDDCEAKACAYYINGMKSDGETACFTYQSRKDFRAANIVVSNHTLTLIDAMNGVGSIFGEYHMLIVDEAHSLPEKAVDVWGVTFKENTISKTLQWIDKKLVKVGVNYFGHNYLGEWRGLEEAVFAPFKKINVQSIALKDIKQQNLVQQSQIAADALVDRLLNVRRGIGDRPGNEAAGDMLIVCKEKLTKIIAGLQNIYGENMDEEHKDNWLAFLEMKNGKRGERQATLHLKPIEIAPLMNGYLWKDIGTDNKGLNSAILVSATMKVNNSFVYMKRTLGLPTDKVIEFTGQSPFDFSANVKGYFPRHLSPPPEYGDRHSDEVLERYLLDLEDEIVKIILMMKGRCMILFTNIGHMTTIQERIVAMGRVPYPCYLQGEKSKPVLIEMFQREVASCLFATRSFFTGVDIPGEALSCVMLTKCPFPVPSDPLFAARSAKIEERGQKAFDQLSMPMMLFDVKQAFGRLIRTHTDEGVFVLLDSKAMKKGYFGKVVSALPDFPIFKEL